MSTPSRSAFAALFDDAAMFPPGNASASDGLTGHLRLRASSSADLVGPLLVPTGAWDDFRRAHHAAGSPPVAVVLIGTTALPADLPAEITVTGFEAPVPDTPLPALPAGRSLAAEIAIGAGAGRVLAAVAEEAADGRPVMAKFRTGGTTADAFPSDDLLARVIADAVAAGAPMKLTAGLHHAVRHTDPVTGFEHHGFLNVLVAFAEARAGTDVDALAAVLAEREPAAVVAAFRRLSGDQLSAARASFVSFGCCGVEDPIDDLVTLGLLDDDPAEAP